MDGCRRKMGRWLDGDRDAIGQALLHHPLLEFSRQFVIGRTIPEPRCFLPDFHLLGQSQISVMSRHLQKLGTGREDLPRSLLVAETGRRFPSLLQVSRMERRAQCQDRTCDQGDVFTDSFHGWIGSVVVRSTGASGFSGSTERWKPSIRPA